MWVRNVHGKIQQASEGDGHVTHKGYCCKEKNINIRSIERLDRALEAEKEVGKHGLS